MKYHIIADFSKIEMVFVRFVIVMIVTDGGKLDNRLDERRLIELTKIRWMSAEEDYVLGLQLKLMIVDERNQLMQK